MTEPFLGRDEELRVIDTMSRSVARDRTTRAVTIVGDPGLGKSRLLAEVTHQLPIKTVFIAGGYEPESDVPLAATIALLRRLSTMRPAGALARLLDDQAPASGVDSVRVFEAARTELAQVAPVAFVVDDVQWIDERSLALLHYLMRSGVRSGPPILLIAAGRRSERTGRLVGSLTSLLDVGATSIELSPLGRESGIELLRSLMPGTSRADLELLWSRSAGSPFWLHALARGGGRTDPSEIVDDRRQGISADGRSLLATLAVAGRPTTPNDLRSLTKWDRARVARATAELVDRGLIVDTPDAIAFTHDLIREAIERTVPDDVGRRTHSRLAALLEAQAGDDVTALRLTLEHRLAAGDPVLDLATRLATSPHRRLLGPDGLGLLAQIADRESAEVAGRPSSQTFLAALAALAGELGDDALAFRLASDLAQRLPLGEGRARAALAAATAAYHLEWVAEVRANLLACRESQPFPIEIAIEADCLEASVLLYLERDFRAESEVAERGLAASRAAAKDAGGVSRLAPEVLNAHISALTAAYLAAMHTEDIDRLVALSDELVAATRGRDDLASITALSLSAQSMLMLGRLAETENRYRDVWTRSHAAMLPVQEVDAGFLLGYTLVQRGRFAAARVVIDDVSGLADRVADHGRLWGTSRVVRHELALATGSWDQAMKALLQDAAARSDPHHRLAFHQTLALWLARIGGERPSAEAADQIELARGHAAAARCPRCIREVEITAGEVYARTGRPRDAAAAIHAWDAAGHRSHGEAMWMRGLIDVLLQIGDTGAAMESVDALRVLRDEVDVMGYVLDAIWVQVDIARAMSGLDRSSSIDAYQVAAERARTVGATTIVRIVERELRGLGVRAWRRSPTVARTEGIAALSPRELEVARLVAAGLTNPQIASQLFLSRKTVEHHVSSALAKVGAHRRAELAAAFGQRTTS